MKIYFNKRKKCSCWRINDFCPVIRFKFENKYSSWNMIIWNVWLSP
jgi:NAD-dependent dihydropyrimidine dehydrogenase PreA subunit